MMNNPFKKKKSYVPKTIIHPDLKKLVQKCVTIEIDGKDVDFYEFGTMHDMPARRLSKLNDMIEDSKRGFDREELTHLIDELKENLESNSVEGVTNALIMLKWAQQRMLIEHDADLVLRLISCAIFTKDEDLRDYDWDIGSWKIEQFEKSGLLSFFLSEPLSRYWTRIATSKSDIQIILEQRKAKAQALKGLKEMGVFMKDTLQEMKK